MDRCIRTLGDLSALDVAGRVIKYSKDGSRTWRFARLLGRDDSAVDTIASGMAIVVGCERRCPARRALLTAEDFRNGMIVMQAVVDEALGRKWWD